MRVCVLPPQEAHSTMSTPLRLRITFQDLVRDLKPEPDSFPKYTSQLINLANQNSQGTRPRAVGQLSELIQEFPGRTYEEWVAWYMRRHPTALDQATARICQMLEKLKTALAGIDERLVHRWVTDLVLRKTFVGLRFQEAILRRLAAVRNVSFRCATPEEESQGIDGFLGDTPVSVKPDTYKSKPMLREEIAVGIVFYKKQKGTLVVEWNL